jgi:ribosome-associated heat shock protein Hsp15
MSESLPPAPSDPGDATLRLDKWLFHARVCKSRTLAAKLCEAARIRVSGTIVQKAHFTLRVGDVVTLPWGPHIRVLRVRALGTRRGPPAEARTLYEDLAPPPIPAPRVAWVAERAPGAGRPTKAERRAIGRLKEGEPDG